METNDTKTRTVQTEAPFVLPVSVPFTGLAAETATAYTGVPLALGDGDLEVLGLLTDLSDATALFTLNNIPILGDDQIPLSLYCGKPATSKAVQWLERPFTIPQGSKIKTDLVNVGGEGAGTLVYICRVKNKVSPRVASPEEAGDQHTLILDSGFTGSATDDNKVASEILPQENFLLYGLQTNLASATLRIFGIDGAPWNDDPIPVWGIAGAVSNAEDRVRRLHKPYLIPAGYKMTIEFINTGAEAAGQIYLRGQRLPK